MFPRYGPEGVALEKTKRQKQTNKQKKTKKEWSTITCYNTDNPPFFFFFALSRATPAAYAGSQARGLMGAVAAGLHQSHSNSGSKPCL